MTARFRLAQLILSRTFAASLLLISTSFLPIQAHAAETHPYVLEDTEVFSLVSIVLHRDYEVWVSLPESYQRNNRTYPVMFVTDANYAFPVIRSITRRVGQHGENLEDYILVGLSYAKGETPELSRDRDYTPSANLSVKGKKDSQGKPIVYGQSEAYRQFLIKEVFPLIAQHYRADMQRKIFVGHSYGSLLGIHIMLTSPDLFTHYILGSPSLWFDHYSILDEERAYAKTNKNLPAKVYLLVGGLETPQTNKSNDENMVQDTLRFQKTLLAHRYPSLAVHSTVIQDEDHLTVFPSLITRGLKWALPAR